MITKMKKLTLLTFYKDYPMLLENLQKLGVLHIESSEESTVTPTDEQADSKSELSHINTLIEENVPADAIIGTGSAIIGKYYANEIDQCINDIQNYNSDIQKLDSEISLLEPWGNFSYTRLNDLRKAGYEISFYCCESADYEHEWEQTYNAVIINTLKDKTYFITITSANVEVKIRATKVLLPTDSLSNLKQKRDITIDKQNLAKHQKEILAKSHSSDLLAYKAELSDSVEYGTILNSTKKYVGDKIRILEGWFPVSKEKEITLFLERHDCSFEIRKARKGDNVPILLKNNIFTRMYEVLTEMYGLPNYHEFDPTPLIAPFFTLFFGLCLGDAGYGLILIALGFLMKRKMDKSKHGMMNLVITLGAATTLIGGAMGTFFGVSLFDLDIPQSIKNLMIGGKVDGTTFDKLMLLAILIGVVHLSLAMTVKAITSTVRFGFKESLSAWGWLIFVVGSIVTGGLWLLKYISDDTALLTFLIIAGVSALGIFLFNNIHRNPVTNIGVGLWDTYNMATGFSGDILSYIRLYALGLAGGMLGSVFNMLAFSLKDSITLPILDVILCGVVLVVGHALNIGLSCLSAFVHPLRLTFLEYFKNSGYEGNGEKYKPFKLHNS